MGKAIISLILLLTPVAASLAASSEDLRDTAPDTYTVQKGDTLWGISGRFLKQPWRWPEIWKMNQEQIKNPHLIYPGDVIVLDRSGRDVQLRVSQADTVRLSPKVRVEPLPARAVPTISPADIEPFLSKPMVVGQNELDAAGRIIATDEDRVALGAGDIAYVEGLSQEQGAVWQIYRRGDALIDPDTNDTLGYLAIYIGEARVRQFGQVSKIEISKSVQEVYQDDRLLPAAKELPTFAYVPRAPQKPVKGRIVSTYDSLLETGPRSVVALSRGSADGLEVGHVLAIYRAQPGTRYATRTSPLYGRSGLSGDDSPRVYYSEQLTPRDASLYPGRRAITEHDLARFPSERYGLLMVFRTFDRTAFALVMEASRQVTVNDVVTNP
ncbi:MAG: LysM peptidoglycan-binding domain-containing protein [Betaproteobacteria bacterium]|nr:LysM peptidoglycan-binding domain-containing protein [Betaproteobacteria bacterium]